MGESTDHHAVSQRLSRAPVRAPTSTLDARRSELTTSKQESAGVSARVVDEWQERELLLRAASTAAAVAAVDSTVWTRVEEERQARLESSTHTCAFVSASKSIETDARLTLSRSSACSLARCEIAFSAPCVGEPTRRAWRSRWTCKAASHSQLVALAGDSSAMVALLTCIHEHEQHEQQRREWQLARSISLTSLQRQTSQSVSRAGTHMIAVRALCHTRTVGPDVVVATASTWPHGWSPHSNEQQCHQKSSRQPSALARSPLVAIQTTPSRCSAAVSSRSERGCHQLARLPLVCLLSCHPSALKSLCVYADTERSTRFV